MTHYYCYTYLLPLQFSPHGALVWGYLHWLLPEICQESRELHSSNHRKFNGTLEQSWVKFYLSVGIIFWAVLGKVHLHRGILGLLLLLLNMWKRLAWFKIT